MAFKAPKMNAMIRLRAHASAEWRLSVGMMALFGLLGWLGAARAQQQGVSAPRASAPAAAQPDAFSAGAQQAGKISDDELRRMLVGKSFYLRGGYLDDSLSFDEQGRIIGHSAQGSYTLCLVEIDKVRLTKRKVELEGVRYGMHFLGGRPGGDPAAAFDRVRITPNKKALRLTIEREQAVKLKKVKAEKTTKAKRRAAAGSAPPAPAAETANVTPAPRPADLGQSLRAALANILAPSLDARMIASMPDYWQFYYQAAADNSDFEPSGPAVLTQSTVDRKARLLTGVEAKSNEYAQEAGVAGPALYRAVIGADGRPRQIAVARPIGFGLDENAVAAIRNARFQPAMKDGKAVPVLLDLVVQFRIYSARTALGSAAAPASEPPAPSLPGPYSVPPSPQQ